MAFQFLRSWVSIWIIQWIAIWFDNELRGCILFQMMVCILFQMMVPSDFVISLEVCFVKVGQMAVYTIELIMSIQTQILKQFQQKCQGSEFQKYQTSQLVKMTDHIAKINCDIDKFDPLIRQEAFELVPIIYDKKIILRDFVNALNTIFEILSTYIQETQENLHKITKPNDVNNLKQNLKQFINDKEFLCNVFCLPHKPQSKIILQFQKSQVQQFEQSATLQIALVVLLIAIALELVLMLNRFTFLSCLVELLTLAIFILNLFDKPYIRFCILALSFSVFFDFVWCLTTANLYTKAVEPTAFVYFETITTAKAGFLKFTYFTTIVLMLAKVCLVVIFFRFRNNSIQTKKCVKIFDLKLKLEIKPQASPFNTLLDTSLMKSQVSE